MCIPKGGSWSCCGCKSFAKSSSKWIFNPGTSVRNILDVFFWKLKTCSCHHLSYDIFTWLITKGNRKDAKGFWQARYFWQATQHLTSNYKRRYFLHLQQGWHVNHRLSALSSPGSWGVFYWTPLFIYLYIYTFTIYYYISQYSTIH